MWHWGGKGEGGAGAAYGESNNKKEELARNDHKHCKVVAGR